MAAGGSIFFTSRDERYGSPPKTTTCPLCLSSMLGSKSFVSPAAPKRVADIAWSVCKGMTKSAGNRKKVHEKTTRCGNRESFFAFSAQKNETRQTQTTHTDYDMTTLK